MIQVTHQEMKVLINKRMKEKNMDEFEAKIDIEKVYMLRHIKVKLQHYN